MEITTNVHSTNGCWISPITIKQKSRSDWREQPGDFSSADASVLCTPMRYTYKYDHIPTIIQSQKSAYKTVFWLSIFHLSPLERHGLQFTPELSSFENNVESNNKTHVLTYQRDNKKPVVIFQHSYFLKRKYEERVTGIHFESIQYDRPNGYSLRRS